MFRPGEKILVGASGGPDSVSLLHGLRTCFGDRLNLVAVHIHHGLRGEEADSDASWVREFCESLGVECLTRNIEPDGWSAPPQESVQMRARKLRYGIFETLVRERGADRLALGHTADDQAETVLLNLIRGAGRPGLAGIPPLRPIARAGGATVIRPLIETSRELIFRRLREEQISYREDSSNQSDRYLRNRIRRHLIPELASYNPGIRDALGRTAEILRAEESWMESEETRALSSITLPPDKEGFSVSIPRLLGLPLALQRRVTIRILRGAAFTAVGFDHVETLLAHVRDSARGGPGGERRICLPGGVAAILERETIRFLPEDATAPPDIERMRSGWGLPVPGMTELAPWGIRMETALSSSGEDPSPPPPPLFDSRGASGPRFDGNRALGPVPASGRPFSPPGTRRDEKDPRLSGGRPSPQTPPGSRPPAGDRNGRNRVDHRASNRRPVQNPGRHQTGPAAQSHPHRSSRRTGGGKLRLKRPR